MELTTAHQQPTSENGKRENGWDGNLHIWLGKAHTKTEANMIIEVIVGAALAGFFVFAVTYLWRTLENLESALCRLSESIEEREGRISSKLKLFRGLDRDVYMVIYSYLGEEEGIPYVIVNPPENLRCLLDEWEELYSNAKESDVDSSVIDYLRDHGVEVVKAVEVSV